MKKETIRKLLVLAGMILLMVLLTTACSSTKVKCVKEHTEEDTCLIYTYSYNGKNMVPVPMFYPCEKTVCDQYEKVEE